MFNRHKHNIAQFLLLCCFLGGVYYYNNNYRATYYTEEQQFVGLTIDSISNATPISRGKDVYNEKVEKIIEVYGDLVVEEARRIGMPASVKMAQLILESGKMESDLAQNANNCFGIKYKGGYTKEEAVFINGSYKKKTKEHVKVRGKNVVKEVEALFVSYHDVAASIKHHSVFLNKRINEDGGKYTILKRYNAWDIEGWAYGLKEAGYATDEKYPERLLGVIETYNLKKLDK